MGIVYEKYMALPIDKGLLGLEPGVITTPYFCYPVNAEPIGFEGCILYCFLPEYGENPFEYVKSVQKGFDDSRIQYSDEYYDVTGIENPKGCLSPD